MGSNSQEVFAKLVDEGPVNADKLLKEDEILSEEDKKKPEVSCNPNDETNEKKPKKPCANCTCGLADKEAADDGESKDTTETPKTSCGSCYLGDAFRCASCPYRGMPAFKPGEKVTIDTTSDEL